MAQFSMIPSREKILAKIPDYAVTHRLVEGTVTVTCQGTKLAESNHALLVQETRHGDVYYLPRGDVNMDLMTATELSTYCPFKGHASYWSFTTADVQEENLMWSYEAPYPEVEALKDYVSFYTDRTDIQVTN